MGLLERLGLVRSAAPRKSADARVAELQARLRTVRARYDAAQTTTDNSKHWSGADGLSAIAANSRDVRRTLRNRSRYERANNGYADGIAQTLANDTIGTGPRLQIRTNDKKVDALLEQLWADWSGAIDLEGKLWTMRLAKVDDGESFGLFTTNTRLRTPVKLDVRLVEADQVSTPTLLAESPNAVDGIVFDNDGNPVEYHVLKSHPGDPYYAGATYDYDRVPAAKVVHYFRALRPGQKRGVPEFTSAISLFAQLRRYTLATIAAAEVAADFSLVIQSAGAATSEAPDVPDSMDTIELEKRMATVLPEGWQLGQAKPEQPTTTYPQFKREILTEIARPLNMPFNIAAGDSSSYNYSSGRLDHQTYFKALEIERALIRRTVLEPLFHEWFGEAVRISGLLPQPLRAKGVELRRDWVWDGHEHVDPVKEADAQETRLRNNTTTLQIECARQGLDYEAVLRQRGIERRLQDAEGLTPAVTAPGAPAKQPAGRRSDDDE